MSRDWSTSTVKVYKQDYVTCGDHVEVFVYYGVSRPLVNLSKNFLEQTSFADATVIPVHSSVVTVMVNESCSYCLIHAANNVTTTYYSYYEEDQHTYTSYEYPWIFADNAKYANSCLKINIENKLTNKHTILTLNVERIENGALNITGYENLSARSATCDFKKKKNFTRVEQPQIVDTNLQCLEIIINLIDGVDYTRSSISFRAFKWMEDSVDFKLITMSRDDKVGNIRMKFDRFDYPIWLLLSVGEADWIKYLRKVRWDHHDKDCEYLLIEGSPPGKVKDLSRELAIFRDQDLFFPQFLLSRMYSLLIPPNCSPTIVMSSEPIEFGKTIPEQELCAGTALIITPYYHKETKDEIVLDFIMYNFYCYRFLINVIIEVIEVESGVVTVEFRDYFNKTRSNET
ncbi:unnamed protein product, partial [Mesorhabditis belari]|uniref:Uncharacterized protein n=1 Tax=Mesorhabditis belari TaxID=2138241 RepID=A0AAF3FK18_9BILA